MAVPFTQDQSTFLDNYGKRLSNAVMRADGIVKVLFAKGSVEEENSGGPNFLERVLFGTNQNVAWRSHTAQIPTLEDEVVTMASVPQRTIDGTIALNKVRLARARKGGEWALGNLIEECKEAAEAGYVQAWANSLRADSVDGVNPYTLLPSSNANSASGILAPATPATQTAVTAGISRADNSWWRSQYTNTSIDISTEAGRAQLHRLLYYLCVFGSGVDDEPDFGLTTDLVLSDLGAAFDTNRRGEMTDKFLLQLGLRGITFQNAVLIRDSSTKLQNKVCFITTRDLKIKYLAADTMGDDQKNTWDQENGMGGIPVNMGKWIEDIDSLYYVAKFWATASMIPRNLRTHGLADNVV